MNMAGGKLKTGLPRHTFCSWLLGQQVLFLLLPPWLFFLLALFCSVCNAAWSSPCQAVRYLKMLVYLIFYSPKWLFHTFSVQKGPTPSLSSFSIEDVFLSLHWENWNSQKRSFRRLPLLLLRTFCVFLSVTMVLFTASSWIKAISSFQQMCRIHWRYKI